MERRKTPRTSIRKLAYVNFEPYNTGGVVTDVSAAGLRFHTVSPVQLGGVVRLSLTLGEMKQIEAVGELVWTDSTRQIGGVRFVVLPPAAAEEINNWLQNSASANAGENDAKSETEAAGPIAPLSGSPTESANILVAESVGVQGKMDGNTMDGNTDDQHNAPTVAVPAQTIPLSVPPPLPVPPFDPNARAPWVPPSPRPYSAASSIGPQSSEPQKGDVARGSTLPPHGFVLPGQPSTMPWITHFDPDPPEQKSAFARGLIAAVVICVLLAPVVWFGLHRYVWHSSSLWPVNSVASNPVSTPPDAAPTNAALPAPDLPTQANPADANSAAANPSAGNPIDTKSATAANPAEPEQSPSTQAPSAAPAPKSAANPAANSVEHSAQAPPAEAKPATKPEAGASVSSEPAQSAGAQSPVARSSIAASGPRDIAPDSLALASERVAKTPPAPTAEPENPGESQLILAWQYLEGQGGKPRDPTAASQLLWSAVEKGNLTAETTLANLYLRGEGVPKNCDQARVLLSAASDKGDPEAKRKLLELDHTGCH